LGYVQRPYDTYEQINGSIGFKASPYPGLWFNVFGGYQNLKNDLSYLGFDPSNIHSGSYLSFAQDNTENLYLGGEISYDYKDILEYQLNILTVIGTAKQRNICWL